MTLLSVPPNRNVAAMRWSAKLNHASTKKDFDAYSAMEKAATVEP